MKAVRETTKWNGNTPNNIYFLTDTMGHLIAYIPKGTKEKITLKAPIPFDRRGRTFEPYEETGAAKDPGTIEVQGSKGAVYYLSNNGNGWVCTCPGFTFRGHCKHVEAKENG